jgi:hypothetical protein
MQAATRSLLEGKGYAMQPDGSFSRADSLRVVPASAPLPPLKQKRSVCQKAQVGKLKREPSALAVKFEEMWKALGGPELTPEFRFHTRRWRLDYYHPGSMVAIELEGGIFTNGRHSRPKGMQADCDKYNAAACVSIFVYRLTTGQVTRERVEQIIRAIRAKS